MLRISIVEDLKEIRETLCSRLGEVDDFEVIADYPDAEKALIGLISKSPDVVLMDIGLPGISGLECMVQVKRRKPEVCFLMFTVFENDDKVFEALRIGADGYILKREPIPKIINAIREVCNGGAPMSKTIARKVLKSFHQPITKSALTKEVLTERQHELLELIAKGLPYKVIADRLYITEGTVKQHIHTIYKKLQVNNRTEATNKYFGR